MGGKDRQEGGSIKGKREGGDKRREGPEDNLEKLISLTRI